MKTMEQYLLDGVNNKVPTEGVVGGYVNTIDHALRVNATGFGGHPQFYIHPHGKDGDTLDFFVVGNLLLPLTNESDKLSNQEFENLVQEAVRCGDDPLELIRGLIRARDQEKAFGAKFTDKLQRIAAILAE